MNPLYPNTIPIQASQPSTSTHHELNSQRSIDQVQPVYNTRTNHPDRPRRTRRRYEEVPRIYMCNWPECDRGYSTLNHLNTHIGNKKHGAKRLPAEFQALRAQLRAEARTRNTQATNVTYATEIASRIGTGPVPQHPHTVGAMEQHAQRHHEATHAQGGEHIPLNPSRSAAGPFFDMQMASNYPFHLPMTAPAVGRSHTGSLYGDYSGQGYNYATILPDQQSRYEHRSGESSQRTSPIVPTHTAYPASNTYNPFNASPSVCSTVGPDDGKASWPHRPSDASQTSSIPAMSSDTTRPTTATTAVESPNGEYASFPPQPPYGSLASYTFGPPCQRDN
ncbi:hypothetical protein CspeluHIS016_0203670 [Cutaneotrichosporon spelunceum]|uniref:C2H2-type domain-containing protein n=1 Tax=Cutaneotrichosporon spelunceum TaxID=1672016 RepID=A0AAD3Y9W0_9TREE|nr:hypothetical protein CspeluHIS016_0203670 [Cutaneotrichosporon spelunceum]